MGDYTRHNNIYLLMQAGRRVMYWLVHSNMKKRAHLYKLVHFAVKK